MTMKQVELRIQTMGSCNGQDLKLNPPQRDKIPLRYRQV